MKLITPENTEKIKLVEISGLLGDELMVNVTCDDDRCDSAGTPMWQLERS